MSSRWRTARFRILSGVAAGVLGAIVGPRWLVTLPLSGLLGLLGAAADIRWSK